MGIKGLPGENREVQIIQQGRASSQDQGITPNLQQGRPQIQDDERDQGFPQNVQQGRDQGFAQNLQQGRDQGIVQNFQQGSDHDIAQNF